MEETRGKKVRPIEKIPGREVDVLHTFTARNCPFLSDHG